MEGTPIQQTEPLKSSIFPRTDWGELGKSADDHARLDQLIRLYWDPLKIYLVAAFPSLKNEADTLLQDFAQDKIIKNGWILKADQSRGKFRHFLKTSLRNYILNHLNRTEVKAPPISLDELEQDPAQPDEESAAFDLSWANTVLTEVMRRMEDDCRNPNEEQPRRSHIWEMFRIRLLDPILNDIPQPPYEDLVKRFNLKSPTDASNTLLSGKRIFKGHLNSVIKEYAGQDTATDMEIQSLEDFILQLAK